jgi:putative hemolysin
MSEIAVVSSRKARLQQRAEAGDAGARAALELTESPNPFLSTVQVGITLVGILAGAFGGATIADELASRLRGVPFVGAYSEAFSFFLVVVVITFLSLVLGELVPKRLALNHPERIASMLAPWVRALSRIAAPIVHLLSFSTEAVLRILRMQPPSEPEVTEEEIKIMVEQGTQVGVIEPTQQEIVGRVFQLGDRKVDALITPRTEIVWLDAADSPEAIQQKIIACSHSRFPVADGSLDQVRGVAQAKDLLREILAGRPIDINAVLQPAVFVPSGMLALKVLERFKTSRSHIIFVTDEYGGLEGLVTENDILQAIAGDISLTDQVSEPNMIQREDGSWLLDGSLSIDKFKNLFQVGALPDEKSYQTLAGFVVTFLGRIPISGEHFESNALRLEVVDMDGPRVDKVLVAPLAS